MKVLISNPPWFIPIGALKSKASRMGIRAGSRWPYTRKIHGKYFPFPFNMAYADAYLRQMGIDSTIRDSIVLFDEYADFFKIASDFDYVVIETSAASQKNDCYVAKELSKNSKVILVGMHATAFADELIKQKEIYAVLKGEYEKNLANCLIVGLGGVYGFDEWENIDDAPFPTRDETSYLCRESACPKVKYPMLVMWASRGCPYKCSFCYTTIFHQKNRYRPHSPGRIEAELKDALKRLPKFRYIHFDDDTFNIGDERIREISKILKKIGLPWGCMCRTDTCNLRTFEIMKENGCVEVKVGIESGSQRIVNEVINKSLDLENTKRIIKELKRIGLYVWGSFMRGFPTETLAEVQMTDNLIRELKCDGYQYSVCGLLSGTELWKRFEETHKRKPSSEESDGVLLKDMKKK